MQRIDDYTPGGDTPDGKVDFQDISLTLRSRTDSITKSRSGHAKEEKIKEASKKDLNIS